MFPLSAWLLVPALIQAVGGGHAVPRPPEVATAAGASQAGHDWSAERGLLKLTNQSRAQAGLTPLQEDECLTEAARRHAAAMAQHDQIAHQFPGEPAFNQRMAASCNESMDEVAENVGEAESAAEAHSGFMHSPPHRENLLHPTYNSAGFAAVRRGPVIYVVEDFAHSLPAYSIQRAAELISASIDHVRDTAGLPVLEIRDNRAAQSEACGLAHADSLRPAAPAPPGQARYILRFTTMQPETLPGAATKALHDRNIRAFAAGACFERTATYPSGAYFVVLQLY